MNNKYNEFREKYKNFYYHAYSYEVRNKELYIEYNFEIEGLANFHPSWVLPMRSEITIDERIDNMIFSLGMIELISYYKITCPENVIISCSPINNLDLEWFKEQYFLGLGEFFYINKIEATMDDFMKLRLENPKNTNIEESKEAINEASCLIPIGGGKDSAVTLKILENNKENNYCYMINPNASSTASAKMAGYNEDRILIAKRNLDEKMLELNKKGYLNGHTPFSAVVAFSSTLVAAINKIHYIILSNEASSNESTVKNSRINHQYSKTYDFEKAFEEYNKTYLKSGSFYFSLLRPISELQIARIFARLCKDYFHIFKSCNVGNRADVWCGKCAKCLFVYLILCPYIDKKDLIDIFGSDLADDASLIDIFNQLTGIYDVKPFECVGSISEVITAVSITINQIIDKKESMPELFSHFIDSGMLINDKKTLSYYDDYYNEENSLPSSFEKELKRVLDESK